MTRYTLAMSATDLPKADLEAYRAADELVRAADKDRWLAGLFVEEGERRHLMALHAFSSEVARVRDQVSEPMPGEIRLQWWADAVSGTAHGDVESHPIARALLATIKARRLPVEALLNLIEARRFDLYDDGMPTLNDLEGYCGETASALIQLSALVLANGEDPGTAEAAGHAGVAYALTGLMRVLPIHAARGQLYVPLDLIGKHGLTRETLFDEASAAGLSAVLADLRARVRFHLARFSDLAGKVPMAVRPAFLTVALVEPYLRQMERSGYRPLGAPVELAQWRRQITLWRAARRARRA